MISEKDAQIISYLRNNSRKKITEISAESGIPVTTIYDKVNFQGKKFFRRHTTLLDFNKLGLHSRAYLLINAEKEQKDKIQNFLESHTNVNSLYRVNHSEIMAEVAFINAGQLQDFVEQIENEHDIDGIKVLNIISEIKKESFLTKKEHRGVLE